MFRAIRSIAEKSSAGTPEDEADKKKVAELKAAVESLSRTEGFFAKSAGDFVANAAALAADVANVFPAGESLSAAVMVLGGSGGSLRAAASAGGGPVFAEPAKALIAALKALSDRIEERQVARAEMTHYREKVVKLANDKESAKHQSKAETNTDKLEKQQARFRALDADVTAGVRGLDAQVAALYNAALVRFIEQQAAFTSALAGAYAEVRRRARGARKCSSRPLQQTRRDFLPTT